MIRRFGPGALISLILFVAFFVFPVWSSADFAYCESHGGQYPTHQTADNQTATVRPVIKAGPAGSPLYNCLTGFSTQNANAITALATALMTIITGYLAWLAWIQASTARRQVRAYVFMDGGNLYEGSTLSPPNMPMTNYPGFALNFKNSGQSPAKDVITWAEIDVIEPRHENTLIVPKLEKFFALSLGAGGSFPKARWHSRALNAQEIADIASGAKRIYIFGRIEYRDIFDVKHFTNFRYFYQGVFPNSAGMNLGTAEKHGNDFD